MVTNTTRSFGELQAEIELPYLFMRLPLNFLFSRRVLMSLTLLIMAYLFWMRWESTGQLKRKQTAFFEAIGDADWSDCEAMISDAYSDQWKFSGPDLILVLKDIRSQFLSLAISQDDPTVTVMDKDGAVVGRLRIEGRGIGLGAMAESQLNRLEEPFRFHWARESFWPWSWRLVHIAQPELERPEGYKPGDLVRLRQSASFEEQ